MTNLEKAKQLLEEFEVLEEELNDLLNKLHISKQSLNFPLSGKLRILQHHIEIYNNLNKPYIEIKHASPTN